MRLLMISTDKKIFDQNSDVARRQIEYAKMNNIEEMHIVVFRKKRGGKGNVGDIEGDEIFIAPNVWVYSTRSASKFLYPLDAIKLGRFIIERRGITHITTEDSSLTAMAGISLKKQYNVHLEINIHADIGAKNFTYSLENKVRKSMALSYLPKADSIRVVSNRIKDYLVDTLQIDYGKITVRPISVDMDIIRNAPITADLHKKYPQFDKIVLMASRLEREKNIELVLRAWSDVLKNLPKAGLVIVGEGKEKSKLQHLAKKIGDSVVFESWAGRDTLFSYYKTTDIFLVTSLYEGYGMTLAETFAAGCRIVSTDIGIAREIGATIADWTADDLAIKISGAL